MAGMPSGGGPPDRSSAVSISGSGKLSPSSPPQAAASNPSPTMPATHRALMSRPLTTACALGTRRLTWPFPVSTVTPPVSGVQWTVRSANQAKVNVTSPPKNHIRFRLRRTAINAPVQATAAPTTWARAPASVRGNSTSPLSARVAVVAVGGWGVGWTVGGELVAETAEPGQGGLRQQRSSASEGGLDLAVDRGLEAAAPAVLEVFGDLGGGVLVGVAVEVVLKKLAHLAAAEGPVGDAVSAPGIHR